MKALFIFVFTIMIVGISCRNSDKPTDIFFSALEASIDKNQLEAFKNAPKDSAIFYFKKFEDTFLKIYKDSAQSSKLDVFFNDIHIVNHTETRVYYLCFAFQSKLKYRKFNVDEIIQDTYKERLKLKEEWNKKEQKKY